MNPLILKSIIGVLVAASFMAVGALLDHYFFVVPIKSTMDKQTGADLQASHDAIAAVKITTETQNAATIQSSHTFADTSVRANLAIDRMQHSARTNQQCLPAPAVSPGEPAASVSQSSGSCRDTGDEICTVSRQFYNGAIKDSIGLEGHAQWEDAQHFLISKE